MSGSNRSDKDVKALKKFFFSILFIAQTMSDANKGEFAKLHKLHGS